MWLKGLLKLAPNLAFLQLQLRKSLRDLPVMTNLRHLILRLEDPRRFARLPPLTSAWDAAQAELLL